MTMNPDDLEEQMKTLMSFKVPESRIRFWRELGQLVIILLVIAISVCAGLGFQYWTCTGKNPDRTFMQCMRYDLETKRIRK
jgi:hypothetical protein